VTLLGDTFPGRVAASLLTDAGLPEMIAPSLSDYESLALKLASDRAFHAQITRRLSERRALIFDAAQFIRYLESAYRNMWARLQAGHAPEGFAVTSSH
jgi:predicted O-linked N-acetylglucosamine transferase (SPINDLY family)